jgi:hypothetical protein
MVKIVSSDEGPESSVEFALRAIKLNQKKFYDRFLKQLYSKIRYWNPKPPHRPAIDRNNPIKTDSIRQLACRQLEESKPFHQIQKNIFWSLKN